MRGFFGTEAILYRLVNFEGLKLAGSLARKFPSVLSRLGLGTRSNASGLLAEHYIANKYGLVVWKRWIAGKVPDFLGNGFLREIKNVSSLYSYWPQLSTYASIAQSTGRKFYVHVRPSARGIQWLEGRLEAFFGPGSKGRLWEVVSDIPESLRAVP